MDTVYECPLESIPPYGVRGNLSAINIRDYSLLILLPLKEQYRGHAVA
jgi:hypothetical protein